MASKPLLKETLQFLKWFGFDMENQNTWARTKITFILLFLVYLQIEVLLQMLLNWKGLDSVEALTCYIVTYLITWKGVLLTAKQKLFLKLIKKFDRFWPFDRADAELQLEFEAIFATTRFYMKVFCVSIVATLVGFFSRPCFTTARTLPFDSYHPRDRNETWKYVLHYVLQFLTCIPGTSIILGFDALFVLFIIYINCQLKMIKQGLSKMPVGPGRNGDDRNCLRAVKELVRHHNLVLGCVKDLKGLFSILLLNQFFTTGVCICAGMVCIIADGYPPNLQLTSKYVIYVTTFLSELFFFCAAGTYLTAVSESVSEAAFESTWWVKTQPELRRAYVLVIQRANKTEKITAGGMLTLDLESFTKVVRMSLSFFTLVKAVYARA